jgi:cell shape-determining protein MreD
MKLGKLILSAFLASLIYFLLLIFIIEKERTVYQNFISSLLTFVIMTIIYAILYLRPKKK